ncbi:MAG: phage Gp37/Gp68 family protein [Elusimicrobia bacterium]|nr:phage Gp37/Gp68 family protein [Candidatus Obscuribacterium magneticum]
MASAPRHVFQVLTKRSERLQECAPRLPWPGNIWNLDGIHWVIVGGESGPCARPMKREWVEEILRQCRGQNVPFFFKQWGGVRKDLTGRLLHGRTYDEMPPLPSLQPPELQLQFA